MEYKFFTNDTHIGAVHLNVNFLENSIKFYNEILGMNVIEKNNVYTLMGIDNRPLVYLYQTNERRQDNQAGLYHFALLVPTRQDLGNIFQHLIRTQYPMIGASDHDVSEALYLQDPEGNGIEIYHDRPSEQWKYTDDNSIIMGTKAMDFQGVLDENEGRPFNGLPKETVMGHIHLSVSDLAQSIAFYEELFGMDIMTLYGSDAAFMSAGGYHHHLGLNTWEKRQTPPTLTEPGLRKFEINMPNHEDFDYFRTKITEKGLLTEKDGNSEIIRDPNGIGIRVMYRQN